jgi:tRNA (guanine-N7-)-methyltransferase
MVSRRWSYKELLMPRRRIGRHLDFEPPDAQNSQKYLLFFNSRDLFHAPAMFPRLDSRSLFGNDSALRLEIGCGTADFICSLALKAPTTNFVGIDISWKPLFRAVKTASALSLDNIKFIKANFKLINPLLAPAALDMVYLHFPDPNQQPRFQKRRIFSQGFLDQLDYTLRPEGRLSVMTDHPEFFMEMLCLMEQDRRFEKAHAERYLIGFEPEIKSHFQQIWEKHGLPVLRFEVKKRAGPEATPNEF